MDEVAGNRSRSELIKLNGEPMEYESSHGDSGKVGDHDIVSGLRMCGYEVGRTIELRQYEFCRLRLRVRTGYDHELERSDVKAALREFVGEMLAREDAGVERSKHHAEVSDRSQIILAACKSRSIYVHYGLTLKAAKKFESHQVDVFEELPISDGVDIEASFCALSDAMAYDLNTERDRIKSIGVKTGGVK